MIIAKAILTVFESILFVGLGLLVLGGFVFFSLIKYYKRKKESHILSKMSDLENAIGNQHFLYGSLNSIKNYVLSRSPMEAAQYLTELMNLMKALTNHSKQKTITLAQELDTIILYLELEKKRLGEQLEYYQNIDVGLRASEIKVKPLFAYKQIEDLIGNSNQNEKILLNLSIKQIGEKTSCKIENHNFIIQIPEKKQFLAL